MGKKFHSAQGPSQRQLRVGEQLRQVLSESLRRGHFSNPILLDYSRDVTVTEVRPSPDLKNATAYVLSLGGENMDEILPALNEESKQFQTDINRALNLKFTPRVKFVKDATFEQSTKIDRIIENLPRAKDDE